MKTKLLGIFLMMTAQPALAKNASYQMMQTHQAQNLSKLYGDDNRKDLEDAPSEHKSLAKSTAALIANSYLTKKFNSYTLDAPTLAEQDGVCPSEKFRDQPAAAICSGTLIGPDLMLTAAHCYTSGAICANASWVFHYKANKENKYNFEKNDVYRCKEIVYKAFDIENGHDFAIVKLDRKVKGVRPVHLRQFGSPALHTPLILIGHPRGLPTKIADDSWVNEVNHNILMTNVDAYTGNSGSGVFNAETGELEGILSFGNEDYKEDEEESCFLSQVYQMQDGGEAVMKIDPVREFLKTYSSH